jgi:succinate dehydrogenase / fumarate reductase cytochrome b subunit
MTATATAAGTATERDPAAIQTTIGKKIIVAVTGILFIGFVVAHMVGNLHAFQGPRQLDHYAEWLRSMGEPAVPRGLILWLLRGILFVGVCLHVGLTIQLAMKSRSARETRYVHPGVVQASYASRTMRWGGVVILAFVIFHLMDFTWGVHPDYIRGAVYHNVVVGFRRIPVTIAYLIALVALGMHLYHGTWSTFQTLGVRRAQWDKKIRALALTLALVIPIGYAAVPVAVVFRLVK